MKAMAENTIAPVDALWTLFKSQPKAVRRAFTLRLLEEDVSAEAERRRLVVKNSLLEALRELDESEKEGIELPDAHDLFKE